MTRTNIHALSGIRTHDPSNQPAKTHTSDRTATVTGKITLNIPQYDTYLEWNDQKNRDMKEGYIRGHQHYTTCFSEVK
jgi:hypothetical protein